MKTLSRPSLVTLGALAFGILGAAQANAGCGSFDNSMISSVIAHQRAGAGGQIEFKGPLKNGDYSEWRFNDDIWEWQASIVGMWKFSFVAKNNPGIPDGAVIDAGYATWHSDGTELMNSGRAPATGSFCMGVWKQTNSGTFKLNHIALSWDPTGSELVGPANIRESVKVDRKGGSYSGTFTLDQYAQDGTTVLAHIAGTVSATRITAD